MTTGDGVRHTEKVVVKKRSITLKGVLEFLNDEGELFFAMDRKSVYYRAKTGRVRWDRPKSLEEYFPSVVLRAANKLERKGMVEKVKTDGGEVVKITDGGKKEILKFKLDELEPKSGKWDRLWRLVFFDVAEVERGKRDDLRHYLRQLGLKQMQESVWVGPYDVRAEVKYIREILDIPHAVKLGVMKEVENSEDLKEIFGVK